MTTTSTINTDTATITVYSTAACGQCIATAHQLDKLGAHYTVVDVAEDPDALAYVRSLGYHQAPVVVTADDHWSGFRPDRLRRAVQTSAVIG